MMIPPFFAHSRPAAIACLSLAAALAGCGGSGGDGSSLDVALLVGDWQFQRCNTVDGQGERGLMRITRQDGMRFTLDSGSVRYANTDCTGNSTVVMRPPEHAARFAAGRNGSTASLAIFWGNWTSEPPNSQPTSLWVRKGDFMCQSFYAPPPRPPAATTLDAPAPTPAPAAPVSALGPNGEYDLERVTQKTEQSLQDRACYTLVSA